MNGWTSLLFFKSWSNGRFIKSLHFLLYLTFNEKSLERLVIGMNTVLLRLTETPCPLLMCPLFYRWSSLYFSDIGMGRVLSQYRSLLNTRQHRICSVLARHLLSGRFLSFGGTDVFHYPFLEPLCVFFIIIGSPSRNVYVIIWIRLTLCFSPFPWSLPKLQKSQSYSWMNFYKLSTHMWPVPREIAWPVPRSPLCPR